MKKYMFLVLMALLYAIIFTGTASAADLYVDVNQGSDLYDGSEDHPWRAPLIMLRSRLTRETPF